MRHNIHIRQISLNPTRSYMFQIVLGHPQAVQDCIKKKYITILITSHMWLLISLYRPTTLYSQRMA